jgi:hypothetical protein
VPLIAYNENLALYAFVCLAILLLFNKGLSTLPSLTLHAFSQGAEDAVNFL